MTDKKFAPSNGRIFKIAHVEGKMPFHLVIVSPDGSEKICTRHKSEKLARANATRYNPNIPLIA